MERSDDEKMLCYCRNVRYGDVRGAIAQCELKTIDEVTAKNQAGGGCRSCHPEIQEEIDAYWFSRGGRGFWAALKRLFQRT